MHWGKADAASESNGKAVFNESNGYLSVLHMGDGGADEVGSVEAKDVGTTATAGIIGPARHLGGKQGIFCGEKIANFPVGASPHSTEAWFRAEQSNGDALAWGNEHGQGKVRDAVSESAACENGVLLLGCGRRERRTAAR